MDVQAQRGALEHIDRVPALLSLSDSGSGDAPNRLGPYVVGDNWNKRRIGPACTAWREALSLVPLTLLPGNDWGVVWTLAETTRRLAVDPGCGRARRVLIRDQYG